MPTTGDTWISLETGQILDFATLQTNLVENTVAALARLRADVYGGDSTIGQLGPLTFTYASSTLDLDANRHGVTPDGYRIAALTSDAAFQSIPFEDSGATLYRVGCKRQIRPDSVTGNTADGGFYYDTEIEDVGELGNPDSVVDQGAGAGLYLAVDGLVDAGWTVGGSRPVYVWLVNPVTGSADAIYSGTVVWDAGSGTHRVTVPHYLGQDSSSPSLVASDYQVLVRGPRITTTALASTPDYWYLGSVQSGVFSTGAQAVTPGWSSWLSLFSSEHDVGTGFHTGINAHGVSLYGGNAGSQLRQVFTAHELEAHLGSAEQNGGVGQAMAFVRAAVADPYRVETMAPITGTYAFVEFPARLPHDQSFDLIGLKAGVWILTPGAGQKLQAELIKRATNAVGVSNAVSVWSGDLTAPAAGTWEERSTWTGPAFPFTVAAPASDESFHWRLYFHEANPAQVRVSHFTVEAQASRIEPWR